MDPLVPFDPAKLPVPERHNDLINRQDVLARPGQPWGPSYTVPLREAFEICIGGMSVICLQRTGKEAETIENWVSA